MPPDSPLLLPPLSPSAPGALYEQIVTGVKQEISAGRIVPGAALPSFRQLAEDLMVSLITVKRAYEELEREGIIYRRQGLGTFVAERATEVARSAKTEHARQLFARAIDEARQAGLSDAAVTRLYRETLDSPKHPQP